MFKKSLSSLDNCSFCPETETSSHLHLGCASIKAILWDIWKRHNDKVFEMKKNPYTPCWFVLPLIHLFGRIGVR
jgi:hypothetical protein